MCNSRFFEISLPRHVLDRGAEWPALHSALQGIGRLCIVRRMTAKKTSDSLSLFNLASGPDLSFEQQSMKTGVRFVAGADEAGRGPLAGPVLAAAVILNPENIPAGLNDSKKLSAARREALFEQILQTSIVAIASASAKTIDETDVRKASLDSMRRALLALPEVPDFALIDGRDIPPGLPCPAKALIKGDARSLSISAASIIAKVARDRMMVAAARLYPQYGFEKHAGYGTAAHRAAIEAYGPCPIHRMTFKPCSLYRTNEN